MTLLIKGQPVNKASNEFDNFVAATVPKKPPVKTSPMVVTTAVEKKHGKDVTQPALESNVNVPLPIEEASGELKITFGAKQTVNLGNYESIQVFVSISHPATEETIEKVYDKITDWVGAKLNEAVEVAKGAG